MTRNQKLMLLMLGLLLLLFVALVVWGQTRPTFNASEKANYRPGAAMKAMNALFSSKRNRIVLPKKRYELGANQSLELDIPGWKGDDMRTLKLHRLKGTMDISVKVTPREGDVDLRDQSERKALPRKADNEEDSVRTAYAVTGAGARLRVTCTAAPCELETE